MAHKSSSYGAVNGHPIWHAYYLMNVSIPWIQSGTANNVGICPLVRLLYIHSPRERAAKVDYCIQVCIC